MALKIGSRFTRIGYMRIISAGFLGALCTVFVVVGCASTPEPQIAPTPAQSPTLDSALFPMPPSFKYDVLGDESLPIQIADTEEPAIRKALQKQGAYVANPALGLCGGNVSNAPEVNGKGGIKNYAPYINVHGIRLAVAPVNDTCLSSSFGPRWGRQHRGIDLASRINEPAFAAGAGRILKATFSPSFGNVVLIRHSDKVFTRYAHLDIIDNKIQVGRTIGAGQPLGLIGKTGFARGIHLHYEILVADTRGKKTQVSPFDYEAFQTRLATQGTTPANMR